MPRSGKNIKVFYRTAAMFDYDSGVLCLSAAGG